MEFTKNQTDTAKGVAICLMFAHHLYAFKDRLLNGNSFIPLVPFFKVEDYIGTFGNVCVSMFLFLSGYGLFLGYRRSQKTILRYSFVKIKDFYLTYWLYFLVFVPIGIIFFKQVRLWGSNQLRYSAEPITFLKNFLGWESTYNGEWWFVRMFIVTLVLLFPIYTKLTEKNIILTLLVSLFLFSFSIKISPEIDPYKQLGFVIWQPSFALGLICAKSKFFSSRFIRNLDEYGWIFVFPCLLICLILRIKYQGIEATYDFLVVPFFIYLSIRAVEILCLSPLFMYLGKSSFPLWLVHSFFCYYYFQDIIYFPKWSPLIFVFLMVMSMLSVLVVEYLRSHFLHFKSLRTYLRIQDRT
ncbi:Acyltransferase 3 domain-containing protein [Tumidithrix helvetica PCC 7403]|uniref:acyltransferase family protein n=1 Tax=Tumidithrix helvetica TaxID=3457545 RepID=UPI003CBB6B3B